MPPILDPIGRVMRASSQTQRAGALVYPAQLSLTMWCPARFSGAGVRNGGKLEIAEQMANYESARTTGLYDRRDDQVSLDEVERILI